MKTNKIVKKLIKAYNEGFLYTFDESEDTCITTCNSDCDNCPAGKACLYLSENRNYTRYLENYKRLNIQELCEQRLKDKQ